MSADSPLELLKIASLAHNWPQTKAIHDLALAQLGDMNVDAQAELDKRAAAKAEADAKAQADRDAKAKALADKEAAAQPKAATARTE